MSTSTLPTTFELSAIAAQCDPGDPKKGVAIALALWHAAESAIDRVTREAKERQMIERTLDCDATEWRACTRDLIDPAGFLTALQRRRFPREAVLRRLFPAKNQTSISREQRFAELLRTKFVCESGRTCEIGRPLPKADQRHYLGLAEFNGAQVRWLIDAAARWTSDTRAKAARKRRRR
jgi:hypothetical protein